MASKKHQGMTRIGRKYEPDEVLSVVRELDLSVHKKVKRDFDGHLIKMGSHRYWTFSEKGCKCAKCGIEGTFFVKEKHPEVKHETYHFNLYAIDAEGDEVLMTKDHIVPTSLGGPNHISNYQPMCEPCNIEKADNYEGPMPPALAEEFKPITDKFGPHRIVNPEKHSWGYSFDLIGAKGLTWNQMSHLSEVYETDIIQCYGKDLHHQTVKIIIK